MKHKAAAVSSAEPELCGDLIREILIKLPVKSLLRFKQVSKTWLRMITSNSFIYSHNSAAQNRQSAPSYFIFRYAMAPMSIRLHLYSSSIDSWKVILTPEESVVRCWMGDGVNLNDKYHILSMEKKEEYDDYHIMTFDYNSEVFGRIESA
uniref:F-box domain-containing protein n=1 Tax=Kalanchoe fedtschenkoi TaxID=63787 RepID=A0A7N0VJT9_KALFE